MPRKSNWARIPYLVKPSFKRGQEKDISEIQELKKLTIHELLLKEVLNYTLQPGARGGEQKRCKEQWWANKSAKNAELPKILIA